MQALNTPLSQWGVTDVPEPTTITFTLEQANYPTNNRTFEADPQMTWDDFINSDYNTDDVIYKSPATFDILINTPALSGYIKKDLSSSGKVKHDDLIVDGKTYYVSSS